MSGSFCFYLSKHDTLPLSFRNTFVYLPGLKTEIIAMCSGFVWLAFNCAVYLWFFLGCVYVQFISHIYLCRQKWKLLISTAICGVVLLADGTLLIITADKLPWVNKRRNKCFVLIIVFKRKSPHHSMSTCRNLGFLVKVGKVVSLHSFY